MASDLDSSHVDGKSWAVSEMKYYLKYFGKVGLTQNYSF